MGQDDYRPQDEHVKTALAIYSHAVDSKELAARGEFLHTLWGGESVQ